MAYLKTLEVICNYSGCTARASVELYNRWNGARGKFCKKHGNVKLGQQTGYEDGTKKEGA